MTSWLRLPSKTLGSSAAVSTLERVLYFWKSPMFKFTVSALPAINTP